MLNLKMLSKQILKNKYDFVQSLSTCIYHYLTLWINNHSTNVHRFKIIWKIKQTEL